MNFLPMSAKVTRRPLLRITEVRNHDSAAPAVLVDEFYACGFESSLAGVRLRKRQKKQD
jgi:hypothetical protein